MYRNSDNLKKCLPGLIFLILVSCNSYSADTPIPYTDFIKERLVLITGFNDDKEWSCMAYLQSKDLAATSTECAERIKNSENPDNLTLIRETGESLKFTLSSDKPKKGIHYLKPEPGLALEGELPTDSFPIFDPDESIVNVWYPSGSHEQPTFQSMRLPMQAGEHPRIKKPSDLPSPVSGTPVFHNGLPICILSTDGRCVRYEYSTCMKFCNHPNCNVGYIDPERPDDTLFAVLCSRRSSCYFNLKYRKDHCSRNTWACQKKNCNSFFNVERCVKSSSDKQLQCDPSYAAYTAVTLLPAFILAIPIGIIVYNRYSGASRPDTHR
ncbi:hypothetical protein [Endozoicomonas euniceicola]|uniref:Uncharacterized protein n=1 Tax=Endozoicomonas euniceicola TaxID=1234143 RepID=A0ABY6GYX1_9GAMM|nr:hypothetical protein [Endozoicomonas euniceicola]UYM17589.1 hypothetical protein NX720_06675 [Endozoicomonas euniceicola]